MEMLTRYEFGETGIFNALDVIEHLQLDEQEQQDLKWAEKEFDTSLKSPSIFDDQPDANTLFCFFTQKGLESFESCLDTVLNLFYQAEESGLGELVTLTIPSSGLNIVYRDEYQVVISLPFREMQKLRRLYS